MASENNLKYFTEIKWNIYNTNTSQNKENNYLHRMIYVAWQEDVNLSGFTRRCKLNKFTQKWQILTETFIPDMP